MRKSTLRRPEDVKFRTTEESKATTEQRESQRRETSLETKVNLDHFEFIGMIG